MISDSVDQQLYNDTKLDQFGQVLKSAMLVYLSVELPIYTFYVCLTFYHRVPIIHNIVLIIFEFNWNIIVTVMSLNVMSPKRRAKKNLKYINYISLYNRHLVVNVADNARFKQNKGWSCKSVR